MAHTLNEQKIIAKVSSRLVPYLFLCYIFNYLDRFNISFAAMDMRLDLGFGDAVYGFGASMFFVGYVMFEIPSNLILQKVGARLWMARIMLTWGIISTCMLFVKTPFSFYLLRFILGVAEAGFFPGMLYYLTFWIPPKERARVFATFLTSTSLAGVIGGPLSAAILKMDGFGGIRGWQWLFLTEGIPSVILGIMTLIYLKDRPTQAKWLTPQEGRWLEARLDKEHQAVAREHHYSLWQALTHPKVWQLCFLYFAIIISFYGVSFWLPQIIKSFSGFTTTWVNILAAVPFLAASIGMVLIGRHSDRTGERRLHLVVCTSAAALGLVVGAWAMANHPWLAFASLCVTATGIWGTMGPFWYEPTVFLTGAAAAGGIALINSVGNVGGFVGPNIIGLVKELTHSFTSGLLVLALTLCVATALAWTLKENS